MQNLVSPVDLAILPERRTRKQSAASGTVGPTLGRDPAQRARSPVGGKASLRSAALTPISSNPVWTDSESPTTPTYGGATQ
jgi:hypothetical protein